jgi:D-arabinose 1-dehydrogenase-like Zn-dependent alcohol dehydrogenase
MKAAVVTSFDTVTKGTPIIGSIVGTRQDLGEVLALHAAGKTRVIAETRSLDDVNEAIAELLPATSRRGWCPSTPASQPPSEP